MIKTSLVQILILFLTAGASAAQGIHISVDDPRPLWAAIRQLELKYGWQINYEDPVYGAAELIDRTSPGFTGTGRSLIPRQGRIDLTTAVKPTDPVVFLRLLIADHVKRKNPGAFALRQDLSIPTVVPAQNPILDTPISVAQKETTFMGALMDIVSELNRTSTVKVHGPGMIAGPAERINFGASNEPARQALARLFQPRAGQKSPKYVWDLLYAQDYGFVLNVHTVKMEAPRPDGTIGLREMIQAGVPGKK